VILLVLTPAYSFASLNKPVQILPYTDEQYTTLLDSPVWTRADTDTLYALAREFDSRWLVVHDRWPDDLPARPVEDLKSRFYATQKVLLRALPKDDIAAAGISGEVPARSLMIDYNAELDKTRKRQVEALLARPSSIAEEEAALVERHNDLQMARSISSRQTQCFLVVIQITTTMIIIIISDDHPFHQS